MLASEGGTSFRKATAGGLMTVEHRGSTAETGQPEGDSQELLERSFSRKALLKAGWAVPVAMAVAPAAAFAQSGGGPHNDHLDASVHVDA